MPTLVPVPWQPQYKATPDTLALLVKASQLAGHNIQLTDGWRSYAQQKGYWDARVAYLNGTGPYAPVASNPDTGQRNHMRGAAFDIANQADRAYMLRAGFTPDSVEWWHFNNPNWGNMPIIQTDTSITSTTVTTIESETDMGFSIVKDAKSDTLFACSLETGNRVRIASPYHVDLLHRYRKNDGNDPMLIAELDIVHAYLASINHAG